MSEAKRFRMPLLDDPLSWPRDLRRSGTEIVLASDYDALRARLAEAERLIADAVETPDEFETPWNRDAREWLARGSVNGDERHG